MRDNPARVRHLTDDEIVDRVFPSSEGAPVPLHLAACPECQARVARLREGWLLDRGAVEGTVDAIAPEAWESQAASVMARVRDAASRPARPAFSFRLAWPDRLVRRPILAVSSVAAALILVTVMTMARPRVATPPDAADPSATPDSTSPAVPAAKTASAATAVAGPSGSAASPKNAAGGPSGSTDLSARDASDDELIREIDRLVSDDGPLHDLLPQEGA